MILTGKHDTDWGFAMMRRQLTRKPRKYLAELWVRKVRRVILLAMARFKGKGATFVFSRFRGKWEIVEM